MIRADFIPALSEYGNRANTGLLGVWPLSSMMIGPKSVIRCTVGLPLSMTGLGSCAMLLP
jgi:hypothetical protein